MNGPPQTPGVEQPQTPGVEHPQTQGVKHPQTPPSETHQITFGPVPSRRLGRSLGINNIPPKICSYSCVYCQVGPTTGRIIEPRSFLAPRLIAAEVFARVRRAQDQGEAIDYLTVVPDGEPTLDSGLGEILQLLRPLGIAIAVITNGSLLWRPDVRRALSGSDWVSVKVDAVTDTIWSKLNRPHPGLTLDRVMDGILEFSEEFGGRLVTETMLIDGLNDTTESVTDVGRFLSTAGISLAYLAIPTRPTPYPGITAPSEDKVNRCFQALIEHVAEVELLVGYEGDTFAAGDDPQADLLSITAVHPMRASAVERLLEETGTSWTLVETLVEAGALTEVEYEGERYYLRRWRRREP